jgi:hypothetical protein
VETELGYSFNFRAGAIADDDEAPSIAARARTYISGLLAAVRSELVL